MDTYIKHQLSNPDINEWESYLVNYFKSNVNEGDTVIDIGGYVGTHSIVLSKLVGNKGRVYTFEPFPVSFNTLFYNIINNKCFNVILYNCGLGNTNTIMKLPNICKTINTVFNWGCIKLEDKEDKEDKISDNNVYIKKLDDFNINPKLIKIDVEGMEFNVLLGAENTIKKNKPILIVEINYEEDEYNYTNVKNYLWSLGYKIKKQFLQEGLYEGKFTSDFLFVYDMIE